MDYSRFRSTEGLFHPEVWGKDHPGLHTLVYNAIQACNVDIRKQMCRWAQDVTKGPTEQSNK